MTVWMLVATAALGFIAGLLAGIVAASHIAGKVVGEFMKQADAK